MFRSIWANRDAIENWIEKTYNRLVTPVLLGLVLFQLGLFISIIVIEMAEGHPPIKSVDNAVIRAIDIYALVLFVGSTISGIVVGDTRDAWQDFWSSIWMMFLISAVGGLVVVTVANGHGITWSARGMTVAYGIWWAYMFMVSGTYFTIVKWRTGWRPRKPNWRVSPQCEGPCSS